MVSMVLAVALSVSPPSDADVRTAVARSLPYLEQGGIAWMNERGCVSCHRVSFLIWSHNDARAQGIPVDDGKVEEWTNWALVSMLAGEEDGGGIDTMCQMLLGRDRASRWRRKPPRHFKTVDPYETLYSYLLDRQEDDGSWPPEGQLATPPELTTSWVLLAFASREEKAGDPGVGLDPDDDLASPLIEQLESIESRLPESRRRALHYLETVAPYESNQALMLRAVREWMFGDREGDAPIQELVARQAPDGGWSNRRDRTEGDAFATGQALYGLSLLGAPRDHPAILRAREFLVHTQRDDGSWHVRPEWVREGREGDSLTEVYSYWGSAWAAIGLLRTLPAPVEDRSTGR